MRHIEWHRADRIGWLRAAVMGANDGVVSTASLIVGVAASDAQHSAVLLAGIAGLVAGAMSMAAGEYVSVSSQADTERADLERERTELATQPAAELEELTGIYVSRGLEPALARRTTHGARCPGHAPARRTGSLGVHRCAPGAGRARVSGDVCRGCRAPARHGGLRARGPARTVGERGIARAAGRARSPRGTCGWSLPSPRGRSRDILGRSSPGAHSGGRIALRRHTLSGLPAHDTGRGGGSRMCLALNRRDERQPSPNPLDGGVMPTRS